MTETLPGNCKDAHREYGSDEARGDGVQRKEPSECRRHVGILRCLPRSRVPEPDAHVYGAERRSLCFMSPLALRPLPHPRHVLGALLTCEA
jgi:hypothetical protein